MKTIILSLLTLTVISCDSASKEFIGTSWIVTSLERNGEQVRAVDDIILTVKEDAKFALKLDVNNCFGTYKLQGDKIKLKDLLCTEICCDSKFSMDVAAALSEVDKISMKDHQAILSGAQVKIVFEKYEAPKLAQELPIVDSGKQIATGKPRIDGSVKIEQNQQQTTPLPAKDGIYIGIRKTLCKGTCPDYEMKFYKDGTIHYVGRQFVEVKGAHVKMLNKDMISQLFARFEKSNFKNFANKYDDELIMDLPSTYLVYKGKEIHIRFLYEAPKELQELVKLVEQYVNETGYVTKKK